MSSTEGTKKPLLRPHLIYALSLVAILILSSFTALLFFQNQSLQKDSENTTLTQLSWLAEDVSRKIYLFTGQYSDAIWNSYVPLDNTSQPEVIQRACQRIDTVAQDTYYDLWLDMGRIEDLDNQSNRPIYHNISETIRVSFGQVDELRVNNNISAQELPTFLWQLYNITGLNSDVWNIGLNGIAYSFSLLSDWWNSEANDQSSGWVPSVQTCLNFALGNATALYGQLTAWSSYRNPLNYDFSYGA